ncbi:MAG: transcription elongation factor GreA, partial [Bacteroidales bacterium]|nr:transcription elongation factor GreA [Bacteroidales bacterium]
GDLSENAEYEAAKEAQAMLELKIAKLQETISNARIVNPTKVDISKVYIFNSVKVLNLDTKTEIVYTIVPDNEVNIKEGKISMSSPIAGGLLGKKTGDKTEINIPAGKLNLKILKIFRADK